MSSLDDRLERFASRTEANLDASMAWLSSKQDELGSTDSLAIGVAYNVGMVAIGLAAAWHFSASWIVALAVAWTILHAYPLGRKAWEVAL